MAGFEDFEDGVYEWDVDTGPFGFFDVIPERTTDEAYAGSYSIGQEHIADGSSKDSSVRFLFGDQTANADQDIIFRLKASDLGGAGFNYVRVTWWNDDPTSSEPAEYEPDYATGAATFLGGGSFDIWLDQDWRRVSIPGTAAVLDGTGTNNMNLEVKLHSTGLHGDCSFYVDNVEYARTFDDAVIYPSAEALPHVITIQDTAGNLSLQKKLQENFEVIQRQLTALDPEGGESGQSNQ